MKTGMVIALSQLLGSAVISCKKADAPAGSGQAAASTATQPQVYALHGVVKGFRENNKIVVIDHSAVVGLMDAMTMGFELADPSMAAGVSKGDTIDAVLEVGESSFKITRLKKAAK